MGFSSQHDLMWLKAWLQKESLFTSFHEPPEPRHIMAATPESPYIMGVSPRDCPCPVVLEVIPLSTVLLVVATGIVCVWTAYTSSHFLHQRPLLCLLSWCCPPQLTLTLPESHVTAKETMHKKFKDQVKPQRPSMNHLCPKLWPLRPFMNFPCSVASNEVIHPSHVSSKESVNTCHCPLSMFLIRHAHLTHQLHRGVLFYWGGNLLHWLHPGGLHHY